MRLENRTVSGWGQSLFELRLRLVVKTSPARTKVKGVRLNHLHAQQPHHLKRLGTFPDPRKSIPAVQEASAESWWCWQAA